MCPVSTGGKGGGGGAHDQDGQRASRLQASPSTPVPTRVVQVGWNLYAPRVGHDVSE